MHFIIFINLCEIGTNLLLPSSGGKIIFCPEDGVNWAKPNDGEATIGLVPIG
jgi:hypothetical protein